MDRLRSLYELVLAKAQARDDGASAIIENMETEPSNVRRPWALVFVLNQYVHLDGEFAADLSAIIDEIGAEGAGTVQIGDAGMVSFDGQVTMRELRR